MWVYPRGERYYRFPRVGQGSETVCPGTTTTYEMRILMRDGTTTFREVTVNVAGPVPTAMPTLAPDPLAGTRWEVVNYNNGQGALVTLLDGSRFGPAQAEGRALVVVFWSTTCPFCRRHNQHVEALHRAAAGRRLAVLGVARERDAAAVRRHAGEHGYTFPITLDHAPLSAALSARRIIPLTVTVDRAGRLLQVIPGEMFEADVLEVLQLADKEIRT